MENSDSIKAVVREKYGVIAERSETSGRGCGCGSVELEDVDFGEDYSELAGYNADADLGLGCGLPTKFARIEPGVTVLDLGAGAGNDCFVARALVGETGRVIGVDMTEQMVDKARRNAEKLGYTNVEFRLGEIEALPVADDSVDVVVSNCVMNLAPDKGKAFAETYRVLKSGGHFSISDIVIIGELPDRILNDLSAYVGCVAGAVARERYLQIIEEAGFRNVTVQSEREITLPDDMLTGFLAPDEISSHRNGEFGVCSITVYAEKA